MYTQVITTEYEGEWASLLLFTTGNHSLLQVITLYYSLLQVITTEYEGEWASGKRHGNGRLIKPDGSEYHGVYLFKIIKLYLKL